MKTYNKIINEIGSGSFGIMYSGIKDEEAIVFLLEKRSGEVIGAISRIGFSDIDLIYGVEGNNGYGLAHIEEQHPGFAILIPEIIKNGSPIYQSKDRVLFIHTLDNKKRIAVVRLDWNGEQKHWVVTSFGDF